MRIALRRLCAVTTLGLALVAAKPAPKALPPKITQQVTGPIASYWVDAGTASGMGAMGAGGGQPSMGDVMRMMRGGGSSASHTLTLRLGTTRTASSAPQATDAMPIPPALPLQTPTAAPAPTPERSTEEQPTIPQRPKGRMLIYWGCGEHAGPGQPYVIDFAKLGAGTAMPRFPFVAIHHENPPAPGRATTYGEWPYPRAREKVPASIVGNHVVRGSYTPDIPYAIPADRDYMPPLVLDTSLKTPAGATMLGWAPVAHATGYFASLIGAGAGAGRDDATIVMWSSSTVQTFAGGGLGEYLAPAEVARLIAAKVILPPSTARCAIPAEVIAQVPVGLLSMNAFGEEVNLVDPPRPADPRTPWNINWAVKVRYKSSTGTMLGMPGMAGASASDAAASAKPARRGGLLGTLKTLSETVPH